jgi:hypothetical protein
MSNLYLLEQNVNCDYDTYDACIVVADTPEDAVQINPSGPWGQSYTSWASKPEQVEATYLGEAEPSLEAGYVVLSSFNAS